MDRKSASSDNMKIKFLPIYLLLFCSPVVIQAQSQRSYNAAEIKQGLEALNVTGRVLYIAAHPDDENTRLLAFLSKGMKFRTAYLSLTRGDGGQNLIGTEQADMLGLLRTQELLAARRIDGAEQYFTSAIDFGFSKTAAECLQFWGEQKVLGDVVWVIRKFQPDVIITRFPGDERAGHGAHAASAILAEKAFAIAADPKQFPEQLAYVKPWKTKRIVWNTINFGGMNTTAEDQLKMEVGGYNALLGKSYGEIAAESRSSHRSQGFGSVKQRDAAFEFFEHRAGTPATRGLFNDIDQSLQRYPGSKTVQHLVDILNNDFQIEAAYKSLPALLQFKKESSKLPIDQQKLNELILACAGIWIEALVPQPSYALTSQINVELEAICRLPSTATNKVQLQIDNERPVDLQPGKLLHIKLDLPASARKITQPYWLANPHEIGAYQFSGIDNLGEAENPTLTPGKLTIIVDGVPIEVQRSVVYRYANPAIGEIYQPLVIAPPVTATLDERAYLFNNQNTRKVLITAKAFAAKAIGKINIKVPQGWTATPATVDFSFEEEGEEKQFEVVVSAGPKAAGGSIELSVQIGGQNYKQGFQQIDYRHIPLQTLFPLASARLEQVDLKFAGKRIGYIAGAGDLIPQSLKQIGYEVTVLKNDQIMNGGLERFDAIVTGVRLYNIDEDVSAIQKKLLEYVYNGGTLVQQYNVNAPLKVKQLGPYPFTLSRSRVTEEDAAVTFLKPEHPLLNYPNKIGKQDFEGWVQERGIYFADNLDARYTPILSMYDKGESALQGSLIVTDYGKGKYIYTGLVFYRELPAGVPGAYRLFVNLLSAGATNRNNK